MKKYLIILLSVFISIASFGQSFQKYSGTEPIGHPYYENAKVTYTYKLIDNRKVKTGNYSFVINSKNGYKINVSGKYKDNLKTGLWSYNVTITNLNNSSGTIKLSANYLEGLPNGLWSYTSSGYNKVSRINETVTLTAQFSKGMLINTLDYKHTKGSEKQLAKIVGDANGNLINISKTEYGNTTAAKTIDSILIEKPEQEEIAQKIRYYQKNYPDSLAEYKYTLESTEYGFPFDAYGSFFNSLFFYRNISGDVNYDSKEYKYVKYNYTGFKYLKIITQVTTSEKYDKEVDRANSYMNSKNYSVAVNYFNRALEYKPDDLYAKQKIEECDSLKKEATFKQYVGVANRDFSSYPHHLQYKDTVYAEKLIRNAEANYKLALEIKPDNEYVISQLDKINEYFVLKEQKQNLTKLHNSLKRKIIELEFLFKFPDPENDDLQGKYVSLYGGWYKYFDKNDNYYILRDKTIKNDELIVRFFYDKKQGNRTVDAVVCNTKYKYFYGSMRIIVAHYKEILTKENPYETAVEYIEEALNILDKYFILFKKDKDYQKDINKKLKKTETFEQVSEIIKTIE